MQEIIAALREMSHLIEMDNKKLPKIEGRTWSQGWVRFYDTTTAVMIGVDESDGSLSLTVGSYNLNVTIPPTQVEKFLEAESNKSKLLLSQQNLTKVNYNKLM